jgi:hypothetical protein
MGRAVAGVIVQVLMPKRVTRVLGLATASRRLSTVVTPSGPGRRNVLQNQAIRAAQKE